jgi:polyisoprenoid-binding protein YceI
MLHKSLTTLALCAALALITGSAHAANYVQAKGTGSTLTFSGKYQGDAFNGRFPGFATVFSFDPAKLEGARLTVVIPLISATAGNPDYESELRGSAFFDSKKFPQARYTATKFRSLGGNKYAADGTLSLRGVSKPVTLTFTWAAGTQPTLAGTAVVKRLDFGVGGGDWADTGVIPNEIQIATKVVFQPK